VEPWGGQFDSAIQRLSMHTPVERPDAATNLASASLINCYNKPQHERSNHGTRAAHSVRHRNGAQEPEALSQQRATWMRGMVR
jgi:hypothetical protein